MLSANAVCTWTGPPTPVSAPCPPPHCPQSDPRRVISATPRPPRPMLESRLAAPPHCPERLHMATAALPIGPKGHPITGHLPALRRDRLGALTRFAREYGDVVPLRMGIKRAVLLSHPDLVEDLLVTHNRAFLKTPSLRNSRRLLGSGLLTSEGDFWRRQRRLSQPAFSRER